MKLKNKSIKLDIKSLLKNELSNDLPTGCRELNGWEKKSYYNKKKNTVNKQIKNAKKNIEINTKKSEKIKNKNKNNDTKKIDEINENFKNLLNKKQELYQKNLSNEITSQNNADKLIKLNYIGNDLLDKLDENLITVRSLTTSILSYKNNNLSDMSWLNDEAYGLALKKLCKGKNSIQKQAEIIYACQDVYQKNELPYFFNKETNKKESYFESLLFELYYNSIVDEDGFNEWRYGNDKLNLINDKKDILIQIFNFLQWLDEPSVEESEDSESSISI